MKDLQEIKDEYANEQGKCSWSDFQEYYIYWDNSKLEEGIDQIAIRYSQEQNKELQEWKESASKILKNIDLQQLGKLLSMQYGTAIDEQLLPTVTKLVEDKHELVDMLESCLSFVEELKKHGITNWSDDRKLRELINKHKGGK